MKQKNQVSVDALTGAETRTAEAERNFQTRMSLGACENMPGSARLK
jgi:hypothetical protein